MHQQLPSSLTKRYPSIARLARSDADLSPSQRVRLRRGLESPLSSLQIHLDLVAAAVRAPDVEFSAVRLLDVLAGVLEELDAVEAVTAGLFQDRAAA